MYHKKNVIYFFLFTSIIFLGLFAYKSNKKTLNILQLEYANDKIIFYYKISNAQFGDESPVQINSFYDEYNDEYCLLFPHAYINAKSDLVLYGSDVLVVDQEFYSNGSRVNFLNAGKHSLAINGSFFVLNVQYGSDIDTVFLQTSSKSHEYIDSAKENVDSGHINMFQSNGKLQYSAVLEEIHGHGNASWERFLKKSYSIKLASSIPLAGNEKSNAWNLISNAQDNSHLRNKLMFDLGNALSLQYTPHKYVDLYFDGEYMGLYLLTAKIEISNASININNLNKKNRELNPLPLNEYEKFGPNEALLYSKKGYIIPNQPTDITGGYLIEQDMADRYINEESGFVTALGQPMVIQSPKYASWEQVSYISSYFQNIEDALLSPNGICPSTGKHYSEYIDIESWVKKYLVEEIAKNPDLGTTSSFFYKPQGINTKLYAGPLWDYDSALGHFGHMHCGTRLDSPEDLILIKQHLASNGYQYFYYAYKQEDFYYRLVNIFNTQVLPALNELIDIQINNYLAALSNSAHMDATRWNRTHAWTQTTFEEETLKVKSFLIKRKAYLETIWKDPITTQSS